MKEPGTEFTGENLTSDQQGDKNIGKTIFAIRALPSSGFLLNWQGCQDSNFHFHQCQYCDGVRPSFWVTILSEYFKTGSDKMLIECRRRSYSQSLHYGK